jgi:SHAQKYF class myb-like DNA-binding protein
MSNSTTTPNKATITRGVWSDDEHERFLEALQMYPHGTWKAIAEFVGTRTVRQVQTHAQKYHEKAARRLRDLRQQKERTPAPEPAIDLEMKEICAALQRNRVPLSPRSAELQQRPMDLFTEAVWTYFGDGAADDQPANNSIPPFDDCLDFLIDALSVVNSDDETGSP